MFYALTCIDGNPGRMIERSSIDELIDAIIPYAKNIDPTLTDDTIRNEIEQDGNWISYTGNVCVYILKTDENLME